MYVVTTAIGKTKAKILKPSQAIEPIIADGQHVQHVLHTLLVEDSEENRLFIQSYLKKTLYQVDIAGNGEAAVEKFKPSKYDLVHGYADAGD